VVPGAAVFVPGGEKEEKEEEEDRGTASSRATLVYACPCPAKHMWFQ